YQRGQKPDGPSWLCCRGHMRGCLWRSYFCRCESGALRTRWVLGVMDQYSRRIIGFGVHAAPVDGGALCQMFNRAIRGQCGMPKYLSSDNDRTHAYLTGRANTGYDRQTPMAA